MPTYKTNDVVTSGVQAPEVNPSYQGLIDANPYRNAGYKVRPWQQLLSWLGFRTQADAWQENMAVQASEYDQAILQKQYDEEYNSPAEQIARMRSAGLNPDIDGGSSIDSGSAQPLGEDPSNPMQSSGDEQTIMNFADTIMQIGSTALGLVGSVQGIARNRLENTLLSTQNESAITDLATRMAPFFIPQTDDSAINTETGEAISWQHQALEGAKIFSRSMDKRSSKRFLDTIQSYWNGAYGEAKSYEEFRNNLQSRFSYATDRKTLEDEFGVLNSIFADELGELNKRLLKLRSQTEESSLKGEKAEGEYNQEYYNSLDGSTIAGSENAQAGFNKTNMDMNTILNESIGRMIDKLEQNRKEGGIGGGLSSIALALLAGLRLMITTQGLPSVSRSSSSSNRTSEFRSGYSTGGSQSNSYSVGW